MNKKINYIFGSITAFFILIGSIFLVQTLLGSQVFYEDTKHIGNFTFFYLLFSLVNIIFLIFLVKATYLMFILKPEGLLLLKKLFKYEIYYFILLSFIMFIPIEYGSGGSIGVGNMGLSPQLFIYYPLTGLIALFVIGRFQLMKKNSDGEFDEPTQS